MNSRRLAGILLLVIGVVLFVVGLNASDSAADQVSSFFTGSYTDRTVWYLVGGGLLAICGLSLAVAGGRKNT